MGPPISWVVAPDDTLLELDAIDEELRALDAPYSCRYCGCTDEEGCFPGERWVAPRVCELCTARYVLDRGPRK